MSINAEIGLHVCNKNGHGFSCSISNPDLFLSCLSSIDVLTLMPPKICFLSIHSA